MPRRRRLVGGALIDHQSLGRLTIKVGFRPNYNPPQTWEAIDSRGQRAVPLAYSEQELHRLLKYRATYAIVEAKEPQ